jgi:hypothetical protein
VIKIKSDKIRDMIMPLYDDYWDAYFFIRDSENEPNEWKVSGEPPSDNWTSAEYDDFRWSSQNTPLSTFDNFFLDSTSTWKDEELFLRKEFESSTMPDKLYLKHYLPSAKVRVYLNGRLLWEHEDQGGRKRHYTHLDISNQKQLMKKGKNVLSVMLTKKSGNASFDIGLYTTSVLKSDSPGKTSMSGSMELEQR